MLSMFMIRRYHVTIYVKDPPYYSRVANVTRVTIVSAVAERKIRRYARHQDVYDKSAQCYVVDIALSVTRDATA